MSKEFVVKDRTIYIALRFPERGGNTPKFISGYDAAKGQEVDFPFRSSAIMAPARGGLGKGQRNFLRPVVVSPGDGYTCGLGLSLTRRKEIIERVI